MKIAILALQGAFIEHEQMLSHLGVETFEVRQGKDWEQQKDGLILPGGESTTILKLLHELELFDRVKSEIERGLPVFGTCAGLILLSKKIEGDNIKRLSTMDITTVRNAYGRQLGSFYHEGNFKGIDHKVPMTFIRAPYIKKVGSEVNILAEIDKRIVAARQGNQLVTAFHPELDKDYSIHQSFLDIVDKYNRV